MKNIEHYIIVKNTIPKNICKEIIDESNTRQWVKHQWNNYNTGTNKSESTKELDIMPSTKNQQDKQIQENTITNDYHKEDQFP